MDSNNRHKYPTAAIISCLPLYPISVSKQTAHDSKLVNSQARLFMCERTSIYNSNFSVPNSFALYPAYLNDPRVPAVGICESLNDEFWEWYSESTLPIIVQKYPDIGKYVYVFGRAISKSHPSNSKSLIINRSCRRTKISSSVRYSLIHFQSTSQSPVDQTPQYTIEREGIHGRYRKAFVPINVIDVSEMEAVVNHLESNAHDSTVKITRSPSFSRSSSSYSMFPSPPMTKRNQGLITAKAGSTPTGSLQSGFSYNSLLPKLNSFLYLRDINEDDSSDDDDSEGIDESKRLYRRRYRRVLRSTTNKLTGLQLSPQNDEVNSISDFHEFLHSLKQSQKLDARSQSIGETRLEAESLLNNEYVAQLVQEAEKIDLIEHEFLTYEDLYTKLLNELKMYRNRSLRRSSARKSIPSILKQSDEDKAKLSQIISIPVTSELGMHLPPYSITQQILQYIYSYSNRPYSSRPCYPLDEASPQLQYHSQSLLYFNKLNHDSQTHDTHPVTSGKPSCKVFTFSPDSAESFLRNQTDMSFHINKHHQHLLELLHIWLDLFVPLPIQHRSKLWTPLKTLMTQQGYSEYAMAHGFNSIQELHEYILVVNDLVSFYGALRSCGSGLFQVSKQYSINSFSHQDLNAQNTNVKTSQWSKTLPYDVVSITSMSVESFVRKSPKKTPRKTPLKSTRRVGYDGSLKSAWPEKDMISWMKKYASYLHTDVVLYCIGLREFSNALSRYFEVLLPSDDCSNVLQPLSPSVSAITTSTSLNSLRSYNQFSQSNISSVKSIASTFDLTSPQSFRLSPFSRISQQAHNGHYSEDYSYPQLRSTGDAKVPSEEQQCRQIVSSIITKAMSGQSTAFDAVSSITRALTATSSSSSYTWVGILKDLTASSENLRIDVDWVEYRHSCLYSLIFVFVRKLLQEKSPNMRIDHDTDSFAFLCELCAVSSPFITPWLVKFMLCGDDAPQLFAPPSSLNHECHRAKVNECSSIDGARYLYSHYLHQLIYTTIKARPAIDATSDMTAKSSVLQWRNGMFTVMEYLELILLNNQHHHSSHIASNYNVKHATAQDKESLLSDNSSASGFLTVTGKLSRQNSTCTPSAYISDVQHVLSIIRHPNEFPYHPYSAIHLCFQYRFYSGFNDSVREYFRSCYCKHNDHEATKHSFRRNTSVETNNRSDVIAASLEHEMHDSHYPENYFNISCDYGDHAIIAEEGLALSDDTESMSLRSMLKLCIQDLFKSVAVHILSLHQYYNSMQCMQHDLDDRRDEGNHREVKDNHDLDVVLRIQIEDDDAIAPQCGENSKVVLSYDEMQLKFQQQKTQLDEVLNDIVKSFRLLWIHVSYNHNDCAVAAEGEFMLTFIH